MKGTPSVGKCLRCGGAFPKSSMTRHLAKCLGEEPGPLRLLHVVVEQGPYFLHLEATEKASLGDLDYFLLTARRRLRICGLADGFGEGGGTGGGAKDECSHSQVRVGLPAQRSAFSHQPLLLTAESGSLCRGTQHEFRGGGTRNPGARRSLAWQLWFDRRVSVGARSGANRVMIYRAALRKGRGGREDLQGLHGHAAPQGAVYGVHLQAKAFQGVKPQHL